MLERAHCALMDSSLVMRKTRRTQETRHSLSMPSLSAAPASESINHVNCISNRCIYCNWLNANINARGRQIAQQIPRIDNEANVYNVQCFCVTICICRYRKVMELPSLRMLIHSVMYFIYRPCLHREKMGILSATTIVRCYRLCSECAEFTFGEINHILHT